MAKITATEYTRPTPAAKDNPFVEMLKPFAEKGVDTPFAVEFAADEYKAEKKLIQLAANAHGFSAREVETDWDEELDQKTVKSTFLIRPQRKPRTTATENAVEAEADAE